LTCTSTSTTPAGKLMFQVCGAFAEFERSMIRQRIHAGLKRAVAQGKQLGRPRIDPALEKRIQAHLRGGKGVRKVAREWRRHWHGTARSAGDERPFRQRRRVRPTAHT
jgi:DNA invertase Pin-like site-specific DNA recombinase